MFAAELSAAELGRRAAVLGFADTRELRDLDKQPPDAAQVSRGDTILHPPRENIPTVRMHRTAGRRVCPNANVP